MGFKPFKAVGRIIGGAAKIPLGIVGGLVGGVAKGVGLSRNSEGAKRAAAEQRNAYENQARAVQRETALMNENIQRNQNRIAAAAARGNRSRIRGGGFGDNTGQNQVGPNLG